MNKYLKLFTNHSAYSQVESSLDKPNVSCCVQENEKHYNPWFQDIKKINNYNTPFITSSSNNQFFNNPFTITMISSQNENSATVKTYNSDGWNETTSSPIETITATSNDGINWTCNLNSTYYRTSSYVITITFSETTYKTYYMFDGK